MANKDSILTAIMKVTPELDEEEAKKIADSIDKISSAAMSEAIYNELENYKNMSSQNKSVFAKISRTIAGGGRSTIKALKGLTEAAGDAASGMNQGAELIGGMMDALQKPGEMYKEGGGRSDDLFDVAAGIGAGEGEMVSMIQTLSSFGTSTKDAETALVKMRENIADLATEGYKMSTGQNLKFDENLAGLDLQSQLETIMAGASKMSKADQSAFLKSVFGRKGGQSVMTALSGGGEEGQILSGRQKQLNIKTGEEQQKTINNVLQRATAEEVAGSAIQRDLMNQEIQMMVMDKKIQNAEAQQQSKINQVLLQQGTQNTVMTGFKGVEMAQTAGFNLTVATIQKMEGTLAQLMADGNITAKELKDLMGSIAKEQAARAGEAIKQGISNQVENITEGAEKWVKSIDINPFN